MRGGAFYFWNIIFVFNLMVRFAFEHAVFFCDYYFSYLGIYEIIIFKLY
jgi:hypothetical protein